MLLSTSLSIPHFLHPPPRLHPLQTRDKHRTQAPKKPLQIPTKPPFPSIRTVKIAPCQYSLQNPDGVSPNSIPFQRYDPRTLALQLQSCSHLKQVRTVHAVALRSFQRSVAFLENNLICGYLRFSSLVVARKLFDGMPDRNVVTWTAMLNGYLKLGLDEEVMRLFEDLIGSSIQANSLTYVCLLKLCGNRLDFELGQQIHASVIKGGWSNLRVESALVYFYAQCGDLAGASRAFEQMPDQDVVSWTTMITAYAQHGNGDEALSMFSRMQCHGFWPNEFTVCSALKACSEERSLRFGRQLHGAILKGMYQDDVFVGSSLVTMYTKCGQISDARLVFDLMPKRNTITWTSMISGYARNGNGEEAISLFKSMKRRRIFANNLTVVSILSACGSIGSLSLGKEVHAQILKKLSQSNAYIGSTLIWFYCKCGEYSYAARVLESMTERDVTSWTAIISGHNSLGQGLEALSFLNDMLWEGIEPNPFTYSSALKACAKLEEVMCGKWIHSSANKTQALPNVFVGSALIDMYMKCGCIKDAFRVFETMPERNLVSWKAMIIGYAKNGHCQEALKLMYRMQVEGFHVDDFVLATVLSSCGDVQWETEYFLASCTRSN